MTGQNGETSDGAEGRAEPPRIPIVAIGASAGGLEALEELFQKLPADSGAAFVIVQHLDPNHPSMMAQLLERETKMPVQQAVQGMAVEPNHLYLIPPNAMLAIKGGVLQVTSPMAMQRGPIDAFFRSVAADQDGNVIGIVLSGTGSDGALGLKAIKDAGGITMAQALGSARYDSMPRSAIALGHIDQILPAPELAAKVVDYARRLVKAGNHVIRIAEQASLETTEGALRRICGLLHRKTGHDFSRYKQTTFVRRIERRMNVLQIGSLQAYLDTLSQVPGEIEQLFADLLIGVTQYFRDPEAFECLARQVVPSILESKGADAPVRVWIPGCASGEEAYSVAMILAESSREDRPVAKIFATDIDDRALDVARNGLYPEAISEQVSPERLERFFIRQNGSYRVRKELRDMCVFSIHNLISDPPFSRIDLMVCRNVLIYLESDLQRTLFPLFHYALNPDGFLFLGPSENASAHQDLFRTIDKKSRIFQRRDAVIPVNFPISSQRRFEHPIERGPSRDTTVREQDISRTFERVLLDRFAPAAVIVNPAGEIVFISGRTGKYLELSPGLASVNIVDMARRELRPDLHTAIHRAIRTKEETVRRDIPLDVDGKVQRVDLIVRPMPEVGKDSDLLMIVFRDEGSALSKEQAEAEGVVPEAQDSLSQMLENQLRTTKEHLQTTIEELETSNEEHKSTNEELLSTNEELQSANEELQTSREELQSINEELQTVNAELSRKVDELDKANSDLQNLFANTRIPILFLDKALVIKKFSPAATEVFRLISTDVGRPLTDIASAIADNHLTNDVRMVLRTLAPSERQVHRADADVWYLMRVLPYWSTDETADGVVITFVDITELKQAQERASRLAAIVESSHDAIIGLSPDTHVTSWNMGAERIFRCSAEEAMGRPVSAVLPDIAPEVTARMDDGGARGGSLESTLMRRDGTRIQAVLSVSPTRGPAGETIGLSVIAQDITEQEKAKRALMESQERFLQVSESGIVSIAFFDPEGTVTEANGAFLKMMGNTPEELRAGQIRWAELTPPEWWERAQELLREIKTSKRGEPREILCRRRDATSFWALLAGAMLKEGSGGVMLLLDITERKRAEEELLSADRRKNDFLAILAHELRNPLAPIRNALRLLTRNPPGDPALVKAQQIVERQLRHMTRLVDDLLDIARISSGKILLRLERVDLREIVRTTVDDHRADADAAGVTIEAPVPDGPLWIQGDTTRLSQSVGNLLNNAVKFTDRGGRISLAIEEDHGAGMAVVRVRDTGLGMAPEVLERAFQPFAQAATSLARGHGGLGLGLPLVKGMIELHGGSVEARSDGLGHGTEILLRLPLKEASPQVERSEDTGEQVTRRVLIIEDNVDAAESARMLLELSGHEVDTAQTGAEGLEKARSFKPDVVLCDIGLPGGLDGYGVARALRADPATAGMFVVALTGFGKDDDQQRAFAAGFDKHLTKPVDPLLLERVVSQPRLRFRS